MPARASLPTFNLEADLPTLEQARLRLTSTILTAKRQRLRAIKIIHGYGSSGLGEGRLQSGLRKTLSQLNARGEVLGYIPGEDFARNARSRPFLDANPALSADPDFGRGNPGITIIILR